MWSEDPAGTGRKLSASQRGVAHLSVYCVDFTVTTINNFKVVTILNLLV